MEVKSFMLLMYSSMEKEAGLDFKNICMILCCFRVDDGSGSL